MTTPTDPRPAVLRRFADLIQADHDRTRALYGAPLGVPASYGHDLLARVVRGDADQYRQEWARTARAEGPAAARKWGDEQTTLLHELARLVYPGGASASPASPDEVRALADRLAAGAEGSAR